MRSFFLSCFTWETLPAFILYCLAFAITTPLKDTKATEFDNTATLEFTVSSEKAVVTWLKDGEKIEVGPKYEIKEDGKKRVLVVHDISPEDEGNFSCVVGDSESVATLNVEGLFSNFSF